MFLVSGTIATRVNNNGTFTIAYRTDEPSSLSSGMMWFNSTYSQLRIQLGGQTRGIMTSGYQEQATDADVTLTNPARRTQRFTGTRASARKLIMYAFDLSGLSHIVVNETDKTLNIYQSDGTTLLYALAASASAYIMWTGSAWWKPPAFV